MNHEQSIQTIIHRIATASILGLVLAATPSPAQFLDVAPAVGLGGYRATTGDNHGPGGVFADLDNDGFPDLVLVTGPGSKTYLFRNVAVSKGLRSFTQSFLHPDHTYGSTGAIAGDYDNDGDLDIYLINHPNNESGTFAPNVLYRNNFIPTGSLTFTDVTASTDPTSGGIDDQRGLGHGFWKGNALDGLLDNSLTAAWADVDRDGDLDLYVGNHDGWAGTPQEAPKPGQRDILYRNNGNGTFTDITMPANAPGYISSSGASSTASQDFSSSNAVIFADLNNDRWPDLFVTNKVGSGTDADMTYINLGVDTSGAWLGYRNDTYVMTPPFGTISGGAMGVDAGDFDNDGDLDLYITDFSSPGATAGTNDLMISHAASGALDFTWSSQVAGIFSWGTQWLDVNNDGRLDLYVATAGGHRDFLYVWDPATQSFIDRAAQYGVDQMRDSRGTLAADYDRDGAIDLFVVNRSSSVASVLWENQVVATGSARYLRIKLIGDPTLTPAPYRSTRDAIGARVYVTANTGSGTTTQMREVVSGNGNAASTSSLPLEFGVGSATVADVIVKWPSGRTLDMPGVQTNSSYTWTETQVVTPPTCSGLIQEAEDGSLTGFSILGDGGASGGQYIEVPNGAGNQGSPNESFKATYCFNVPADGTYRIKGWARSPSFADDSFFVKVDDSPSDGYLWVTPVSANPAFVEDYVNDFQVEDPVEVFLSAGDHILTVYQREDGTRLDKLELELQVPPTCGPLVQEAEDGTLNGFTVVNYSGASGGQYIEVPNGTGNQGSPNESFKATYCFNVPADGTYRIKGWARSPSFADDSFFVRVDGSPSDGYLWLTPVSANPAFLEDYVSDWQVEDPVEIFLSAGNHTLTVFQREDGTRLDKLELELQVPPPCGPLAQEAEDGTLTGFTVINDPGASGGQYIEVPNGTGNQGSPSESFKATYCFGVATAGTYRIKGWARSPSFADDSFFAKVDGSPSDGYLWVTPVSANPAFLEDYVNDWQVEDPVEIFLSPGNHTLTIYQREDGTRLDRLEVELQ